MNLPKNLLSVRSLAAAAMAAIIPASLGAFVPPTGISLSSLYSFANAANPVASLVQGTNGNFYGTMEGSGTNFLGAVFVLTPSGAFTDLVLFNGANGSTPACPLFLSTDGNFYGTTAKGGTGNQGILFKMSPSGSFTILARFQGANGANPIGGLVRGAKGYFYGTTWAGGSNGVGEVFAWSPAIGVSNLYSFNGTDGANPPGGLVAGLDGNLYGTTYLGGANGLGTVFQLTPSNTLNTLVSFSLTNGAFPLGLVRAPNGLMYGAAFAGGTNNFGSVFEVTTTGGLTTLASFGIGNGANPQASVILGADGFLYGTTVQGGADGKGVIFRVSTNATVGSGRGGGRGGGRGSGGSGTSSAVLTNLVFFSGFNGAFPQGGLMQAGDGNIYGTTTSGSANGFGNIFELSGFPPTIFAQPASEDFAVKATNHFTVGATGSAPLSYQWVMAGTNLTDGGNISGATNSELTLAPAVLSDAGSYVVVVANAFGSVTSAVATLTVPPPALTIKSPGSSVPGLSLTMHGSASGKFGVANVQYQLNGGAWSPAATTNQWTNWSALVFLPPGTNSFQAYSVDPVGNHSPTNSVTFFCVIKSPLTLLTNGFGTISRSFSGTNLVLDTNYTVTAVPNSKNLFSNWTGTITATNNPLKFLMVSNMTLTANFVTNSFLRAAGTYNGLFYVDGAVGAESSGLLGGLTVGTQGVYTGKLYIGGSNYGVRGNFDLAGDASNQIPRAAKLGPVLLAMHLDWNSTPPQITGTVQGTNGGAWTAALTNELAGSNLPSAEYTMLIPPGPGALVPPPSGVAPSPPGDGYALITNHLGAVSVTGALADGTTFSQNIAESEALHLPFYATPYTNGGLLLGWLDLGSGAPAGSLTWIRPTATSGLFTNGYTNTVTVQSSAWTDPAANTNIVQPLLHHQTGGSFVMLILDQLDISGGFLEAPIVFNVSVEYAGGELGVDAGGATNSLSSKIAPKTGLLTITFGNGQGTNTTSATGAILQNHALGGGFFTTKTNAGAFTLIPTL